MGVSASEVLAIAKAEVGYHEGRSGGHWNNHQKYSPAVPGLEWSQNQAWCCTFCVWCATQAGDREAMPVTAGCALAVSTYRQWKRFSYYPAVGAQVFFGRNGGSHTGLVYKYDADSIWTVEGNTNDSGSPEGDGVYLKKHARRDDYVYGYGYPRYDHDMDSADPAWAKPAAPKPAPAPAAKPKPKPSYAPFPGAAYFKRSPHSALITAMGKRLVAEGCSAYRQGPGPQWTDADRRSYAAWQRKCGYRGSDADGWPGATSWAKLRVPKV